MLKFFAKKKWKFKEIKQDLKPLIIDGNQSNELNNQTDSNTDDKFNKKVIFNLPFVSFYEKDIINFYCNRISFLIKELKNKKLIQKYIDEKYIIELFSSKKISNWKVNDSLTITHYRKMIHEITNKKFIIFRHLTCSMEFIDLIKEEVYDDMKSAFAEKDAVMGKIIETFEQHIPRFFNWNIINDKVELLMLRNVKFGSALIMAFGALINSNSSKYGYFLIQNLKYFKYLKTGKSELTNEDLHELWIEYLNLWKDLVAVYVSWDHKLEWEFIQLEKISTIISKAQINKKF